MKKYVSDFQSLPIQLDDKVLIYGIGNIGRQDDGLGPLLIDQLEKINLPTNWQLDSNFQLNAEDALQISQFDYVLFADANKVQHTNRPFELSSIQPSSHIAFSSHAMSASSILSLCEQLYKKKPKCFWLAIPGEQWEIGEGLSHVANKNLQQTVLALKELIEVNCA